MKEKIVIITGANSGIGKDATLKFAKKGYTIIMACRSIERSKPVLNEIISASGNEKIFLKEVDISSFASICLFCDDFISQFQKLDILINNAAYFNHGEDYCLSSDNIELTFATNVVGPFLMTNLLLDHLKKSDDARILNPCSSIIKHFFSPNKKIDFNNLQGITDTKYNHSVYESYRDSKMAFLILTFKMAKEFKNFGIKVNSLQINGAKMSKETLKKFNPAWRLIAKIQNLYFPLPEVMANIYFEICTSGKYKSTTGEYFNHKQEIMETGPESPRIRDILGTSYYPAYAKNVELNDKIWNLCKDLTSKKNAL